MVVLLRRADEEVFALTSGDVITGDPREMDLAIPVETLEDIVTDPRLGLTTSRDVVDAGEELADWDGGEPDPTAYDRVPSTDLGLLNSFLLAHGGYASYSDFTSSPLKGEFGDGAIGGRMHFEGYRETPSAVIDVLASPTGPDWIRGEPCEAYPGRCEGQGRGRYLAWTPGPDGEVWLVGLRDDEVVAVRLSGFDVPAGASAVRLTVVRSLDRAYLLDDTLGITTDKHVLEFDPSAG